MDGAVFLDLGFGWGLEVDFEGAEGFGRDTFLVIVKVEGLVVREKNKLGMSQPQSH